MKILITILLLITPNLVFGQYVAQKIGDKVREDKIAVALDQADIARRQADIDSIVNDKTASTVTDQIPDIQDAQVTPDITPADKI